MNEQEIRQLKLEQYRAEYERKSKIINTIHWVFIPLIATLLFSVREDISNVFKPFFVFIDITIHNVWLRLTVTLAVMIGFTILMFGLGTKIGDFLEKCQSSALKEYLSKLDILISEAKQSKKLRT